MTRTSSSDDDSKGICCSPGGDGIISTGIGNRVTFAVRDPVKATSASRDCGDGTKVTSSVGDGSKRSISEDESSSTCSGGVAGQPPMSSSTSPGVGAGQPPMRVLAVDDSNIDRKLVEMLLKTSSFSVTAVNSVMRALEVLGLDKVSSPDRKGTTDVDFDLIITDYCMPEMTGYDLLKKVKDDSSPFKDVPVVIMSSENRPRRITKCMAEGAEEFIIKPVQLSDVQRLKCHVRQARETRMEQQANTSSSSTSKRKGSSGTSGLPTQNMERRARLTGLTVA